MIITMHPIINYNNPKTSFKSRVVKDYPPNSADSEVRDLVDKFEEDEIEYRHLGHGLFAAAFAIQDKPIVIKKSFDSTIAKLINDKFEKEGNALSMVPANIDNTQKLISRVLTEKGNYYLVTNLLNGKKPSPIMNPFTKEHYNSLMDTLFQLDSARLYHMDLNLGNCLATKDGKVNILDFQWAEKFNFFGKNEHIDVPSFIAPSNLDMFEKESLAEYLCDLNKSGYKSLVRKNYREYLHEKSNFRRNRVDILKQQLLSATNIDNAKKAIKYEELQSKLLDNPSDELLDLELSHLDILNGFNQAYCFHDENVDQKLNILESVPAYLYTQMAVKNFNTKISQMQQKYKTGDLSEYLNLQKEYAQYYQDYFSWIPENFNWIKRLVNSEEANSKQKLSKLDLIKFININSLAEIFSNDTTDNKINPSLSDKTLFLTSEIQNLHSKDSEKIDKIENSLILKNDKDIDNIAVQRRILNKLIAQINNDIKAGESLSAIANSLCAIYFNDQLSESAYEAYMFCVSDIEGKYYKSQGQSSRQIKTQLNELIENLFYEVYSNSNINKTDNQTNYNLVKLSEINSINTNKEDEVFNLQIKKALLAAKLPENKGSKNRVVDKLLNTRTPFCFLYDGIKAISNSQKNTELAITELSRNMTPQQFVEFLNSSNKKGDSIFFERDLSQKIEDKKNYDAYTKLYYKNLIR